MANTAELQAYINTVKNKGVVELDGILKDHKVDMHVLKHSEQILKVSMVRAENQIMTL